MILGRDDAAPLAAIALIALTFGAWGMNWGLPSEKRAGYFLDSSQRTSSFYAEIDKARSDRYEKTGANVAAYAGRLSRQGVAFDPPTDIRLCYSSFLLRSHDADEQTTLVMVSRLNPFKGRWYPGSYHYLGAYLYPMSAFIMMGKVAGFVKLVPGVSFYYEHPGEMAKIFKMMRLWSVFGFVFGACCLFVCARALAAPRRVAFWTALFYMLLPICLGFAKIGKPHIWAPAWTFLSLAFCFTHRDSRRLSDILFASLFMGVALGTATTQTMFLPFLIWACWTGRPKEFISRAALSLVVVGSVFLLLNPFFPFHFADYRDELELLRRWYPFKARSAAIVEFLSHAVRPSMGSFLFGLSMLGLVHSLVRKTPELKRGWVVLLAVNVVLVCFQMQAFTRDPTQVRPALAALGLLVFLAVRFTFLYPWGLIARWVCAFLSIGQGVLYCRHFASDVIPRDNATRAAIWVQEQLPKQSVVETIYNIPTVDQLPPMRFIDYKFVQYGTTGAGKKGNYLIMNPRGYRAMDEELKTNSYELVVSFEESPLQKRGRVDMFTNANFPVRVYRKT